MENKERKYSVGPSSTRRLSIILAYRMGRGETFTRKDIDELAERYGVTERTVYRALEDVNDTRL